MADEVQYQVLNRFVYTRKNNNQQLISIRCPEENLAALIAEAKTNFNGIFEALKSELVHYLLSSDRELLAGPKYAPREGYTNWGSQEGSVYVAGEKLKVKKPRLRSNDKEVSLPIYEALNERSGFSQEILLKALSGISCRNYQRALDGLLEEFGISKSSISRHLKERFGKQLMYQCCTVHKVRNIQSHLPKKYRQEAHRRYRNAIDCYSYQDEGRAHKS
jgi:transposase-like protein